MARFACSFAGLVLAAAAALASCERTRPPDPPTPSPVSGTSRAPTASPELTEDRPDEAEPSEPPPDEVACAPATAPEPVETWSANGPPPEHAVEEVCAALEDRARRALAELGGPCETAEDCELVRVACPFGCVRVFSKHADRRRARLAFDRYVDECPICKDKCPALPTSLACEDGVCVASSAAPASACADAVSGP